MENEFIPDEFKVEYVFFGLGGKNSVELKDKLIFIHEGEMRNSIKKITIEIEAQKDDWIEFWKKMDEIRVWNWKKSYGFETEEEILKEDGDNIFLNVDGDIWNILISNTDKKIESKGWATGPRRLNAFFNALQNLIKVDIRNLDLLSLKQNNEY
jgi:hypothetical protein